MKALIAGLGLLLALAVPALAVEPNERLADPVLEARAREISKGLRCLVCQNESIDESNADLAKDVRLVLRQRLLAGASDAQAMQYIVDRYGTFVLMSPPVEPATYVLWFGPAVVLLLAVGGVGMAVRRSRLAVAPMPPPLDAAEQARLAKLLHDSDQPESAA